MKSPGFMLLELLVSMVIASMIALALFAAFAQTNRAVHTVDNMVDVSYKETVVIHQLTKDISGAFIPVQGRKTKTSTNGKENVEDEKIKKQAQLKTSESKKEKKRLTKIFYGTAKDGQLNVLTCITNNSTLEYPLGIVRVMYRLVPATPFNAKKPAYVLLRQESGSKLKFDDFKLSETERKEGVRAYEVIGNVKKMSVAYTAAINKPLSAVSDKPSFAYPGPQTRQATEGSAKASEGGSIEREYKVLNEWIMEEEQEKQYKDYIKIPYAVDIDLVLWDERKEREHKISFKIMLPNEAVEYEEAPKTAQTPTKPAATPTPSASSATPGKPQTPAGTPSPRPQMGGRKTTHNAKGSALDQTLSALKTMLLADGAAPQAGAA